MSTSLAMITKPLGQSAGNGVRTCSKRGGVLNLVFISALVAQMDRARGFYPWCCGFDSCQARQITSRDSNHLSQLMPAGLITASLVFF